MDRTASRQSRAHRWPLIGAGVLLLVSLLAFWPGVAMYDTVRQYSQVLSGAYDDWHPPVMARLWALLHPLAPGPETATAPMLALQLAAYWLGLGALAQALADAREGRRALAVLLIGASPLFLGWQAVVLKDGQMVGALACALGLIATYRLRDRAIPWPAAAAIALCLVYATLVRANAAFSTVPLIVLLFVPASRRFVQPALVLAGIALAIVATQFANRHVLGARDSGVSRIEATYDLAGIAVRTGDVPGIDGPALIALHCVKPLFWDPMQARADCQAALGPVHSLPAAELYRMLARAALVHPIAYAEHRLAHLNATLRWFVSRNGPLAMPPAYNEANTLGLASPPCCALKHWQYAATVMIETPLGWPIFWIAAGLLGLLHARNGAPGPRRTLATALIVSALCQEASFALLSISSDLRYHLWAMLAVALAWVLLWGKWQWSRGTVLGLAALGFVLITGLAARLTLPEGPIAYQTLLR